jgi:hypothetical protein
VRENYLLKKDLDDLEIEIQQFIKKRLSYEDVMRGNTGKKIHNGQNLEERASYIPKEKKLLYGKMFYLLQKNPSYLAKMTHHLEKVEIENFLQSVIFTLYGDQYDNLEERLLLQMFQMVLVDEFTDAHERMLRAGATEATTSPLGEQGESSVTSESVLRTHDDSSVSKTTKDVMGSFMRANTAITQMLTTYARRPHSVAAIAKSVGPILQEIADDKGIPRFNELDPQKVYVSLINQHESKTGDSSPLPRDLSPEDIAAHPEVRKVVQLRVDALIATSERILEAMVKTDLPYGVRWICRQLDQMARTTFKDATERQISALIGGFVFLRYINPVIVSPESLNIVNKKPSPQARKNLMMLAKCIQNLSNSQLFAKEKKDLQPLNIFISGNREKIHGYFQELCKVEPLEEKLKVDKYLVDFQVSGVEVSISYNEIAQMHKVVERSIGSICVGLDLPGAPLDPLHIILNELGPSLQKLPNSKNDTITLTLAPENYNPDKARDRNMSVMEQPNSFGGGYTSRRFTPKEMIVNMLVSTLATFTFTPELMAAKETEPTTLRQVVNVALEQLQEAMADRHIVQAFKQLRKLLEAYDYDPSYKGGNKYILPCGTEATEPDAEVLDTAYNQLQRKLQDRMSAMRIKHHLEETASSLENTSKNLQDSMDIWQAYLKDVEKKAEMDKSKNSKKSKAKKSKKLVYNQKQLLEKGIITHGNMAASLASIIIEQAVPNSGKFNVIVDLLGQKLTVRRSGGAAKPPVPE